MISSIVSPYLSASKPASPAARPAAAEASAAPADVVVPSETSEVASASASEPVKLSGIKRAGVAVMAGVALLGAGILAPTAAQAQTRGYYGHSQVYAPPVHHHHNNGGRDAAVGFGIGVIAGVILGQTMPYPSYPVPVPVPVPAPGYPVPGYPAPMPAPGMGYDAYGIDGQYHHFDQYGHVADQTGHYVLQHNQWGQAYRVPVAPHY